MLTLFRSHITKVIYGWRKGTRSEFGKAVIKGKSGVGAYVSLRGKPRYFSYDERINFINAWRRIFSGVGD